MKKSPRRKISDTELAKIALKFSSRKEMKKKDPATYSIIYRRKLQNRLFSHMDYLQKPNNYWTKALLSKEAKKYKYLSDFRAGSPGAYQTAEKRGLLEEIGKALKRQKQANGYWSRTRIIKTAQKYTLLTDFRINESAAYCAAQKLGLTNELRAFLSFDAQPAGYWTKDKVLAEAIKYRFRSDFEKGSGSAYQKARRERWLDEVCQHMGRRGNRNQRAIYAIEFEDKSVYVGLTHDYEERIKRHIQERSVAGTKMGRCKFKIFYQEAWHSRNDAVIAENKLVEEYRLQGWDILNIAKAGSLGGNQIKWTKAACRKEAAKYNKLSDFKKYAPSAYGRALKKGWLSQIGKHLVLSMKRHGYWSKKKVIETAKEFTTRSRFKEAFPSAYSAARKHGWLEVACKHMTMNQKPSGYWTKQKIFSTAKKFQKRSHFKKAHSAAYNKARAQGWLDEIFSK